MEINGQNLAMVRGDSETITVSLLNADGSKRSLVSGDKIYFTVKTHVSTIDKIMQKIITTFIDGDAIIEIVPNDTKNLPFKTYVYDIQLTRADNTVTTIIPTSDFEVMKEVTYE